VQSIWLTLQCIARATQRLPVSLLEIFSLEFVFSTMMTYFFWLRKPRQVKVPTTIIHLSHGTVAEVLSDAGQIATDPFQDTPLDFIQKSL
jgi:hypothetical protein